MSQWSGPVRSRKQTKGPLEASGGVDRPRAVASAPVKTRVVYSTGVGRICPDCGRPSNDCQCGAPGAGRDAVPAKITAKLRLEKKGRGGKVVTVIDGLPNNAAFLSELAAELKRACGTGGTVQAGAVELAGDMRERVRPLLAARGMAVKG